MVVLNVLSNTFKNDLLSSNIEATKLGGGISDVNSITSDLSSNFGITEEAAKISIELSSKFDTSKAIGLSADEGANLFGVLKETANLSVTKLNRFS